MTRIVDLSMPIEDHFRWPVERSQKGDLEAGDVFQISRLGWIVHGFHPRRRAAATWSRAATPHRRWRSTG